MKKQSGSSVPASGFTLIEMLTTVAILVILLGLMVSLARFVRDRSAQQLTRETLRQLDGLMAQYVEHNGGQLPEVEPLLPTTRPAQAPDEGSMLVAAKKNNEQYVRALKIDYRRLSLESPPGDPFDKLQLPLGVYDLKNIRDAWGNPIVFMPRQHELIGLAPSRAGQDQSFFFSAGPDRRFITRDDNVYSYETSK